MIPLYVWIILHTYNREYNQTEKVCGFESQTGHIIFKKKFFKNEICLSKQFHVDYITRVRIHTRKGNPC